MDKDQIRERLSANASDFDEIITDVLQRIATQSTRIEELEAELAKHKWVSVRERLPETAYDTTGMFLVVVNGAKRLAMHHWKSKTWSTREGLAIYPTHFVEKIITLPKQEHEPITTPETE